MHYCGKRHQLHHWKLGGHSKQCKEGAVPQQEPQEEAASVQYPDVFEEFELVTEEEVIHPLETSDTALVEKMEDTFRRYKSVDDLPDDGAFETFKDKAFLKFQKAILPYKDQVLRYKKGIVNYLLTSARYYEGDAPLLWVSEEGQPKDYMHDIPKCQYCGSERVAELQVKIAFALTPIPSCRSCHNY